MTIEELDDPREDLSTGLRRSAGRARLLAATAGALLGLTLSVAVQLAAPVVSEPCERTTKRDPAGVITVDGNIGIVGDTFSASAEGTLLIVRRGAKPGDSMNLKFARISATDPGMAVFYGVSAADQKSPTPWGDPVAFAAGWKPIGFSGSCWSLIVDGSDTGLTLAVGPYEPRSIP